MFVAGTAHRTWGILCCRCGLALNFATLFLHARDAAADIGAAFQAMRSRSQSARGAGAASTTAATRRAHSLPADQALAVVVTAELIRRPLSASLLAVACAQDMRSWQASFGHSGICPHGMRDWKREGLTACTHLGCALARKAAAPAVEPAAPIFGNGLWNAFKTARRIPVRGNIHMKTQSAEE